MPLMLAETGRLTNPDSGMEVDCCVGVGIGIFVGSGSGWAVVVVSIVSSVDTGWKGVGALESINRGTDREASFSVIPKKQPQQSARLRIDNINHPACSNADN